MLARRLKSPFLHREVRLKDMEIDVHNKQRNFEQAFQRLERDAEVSVENKKLLLSFAKTRLAKGVSKIRVVKYLYTLRFLAKWYKRSFNDATKADLLELVGDLENKNYAQNTKHDFKIMLKAFFKWLKGNDEIYPPEISWLKSHGKNKHKLPEELLTEEEVFQMAAVADHPRTKAMILLLYETGCRIGELLSLRMKNVQFDAYGAVLRVTGKTGDRRVRIISSAPALSAWINIYPHASDPEASLWPPLSTNYKNSSRVLDYRSVYVALCKIAKKAGITKRIYPHLFRHSRATVLAGKLTEAQMKEYFGWVQASDMASVYVHLSGRDVDNALLALQGFTKLDEKKEDQMRIKICQRCQEKNSPIAKFCIRCSVPTDVQFVVQIQEQNKIGNNVLDKLMEDSEFKELMFKKVLQLGLVKQLA